jgi:hypothetical protein
MSSMLAAPILAINFDTLLHNITALILKDNVHDLLQPRECSSESSQYQAARITNGIAVQRSTAA